MYPKVYAYLERIQENAKFLKSLCTDSGVEIIGVTKVVCGEPTIAHALKECGIEILGDSRVQNIKKMRNSDIKGPFMLLRIPMISELDDVAKYVDYTLISDLEISKKLGNVSSKFNKRSKVIYMVDVGDLREGVWFEKAVSEISKAIDIEGIEVVGIGTNLGCFGGVIPDETNMERLVKIKEEIQRETGKTLEIISGGNTAALPLIEKGSLPKGVNQYRLGESIICGTDATNNRNVPGTRQDTIILEAEIVELKEKPSVPYGNIGYDAFGRKPKFKDKGNRIKGILAVGEQDVDPTSMYPLDKNIEILHASSDHTIVDLTESKVSYKVGDKIRSRLGYSSVLRAFTSPYVEKVIL
ncbi:alanine/ornithine racemase family PLP-dependent enzyme [Petrotoga sibirica]|uniref:Alanine racemase n=2 Tax=Petrotoga sibirica TaxID=156202 RepID=A0A855MTU9_9BACT|nr:alanine/ornithine racemase family PLP-dependent enzyme [Petrotoga sibirica]POZ88810.1 alanine racemase [Petrotoga sibirica DSM 13575]TDX17429.1 putative amino acid racemase [Petrotoga sibirica]